MRKSNIFSFIVGAILFGCIGTVAAYNMLAKDIKYTPSDTTWNVDNVEDAIDELRGYSLNKGSLLAFASDNVKPTTSYSSNISPIFYNNEFFDYNESSKELTAKVKMNLKFYFTHGWINGATGAKVCVKKNNDGSNCFHFETKRVQEYTVSVEQGDKITMLDKFDVANNTSVIYTYAIVKN